MVVLPRLDSKTLESIADTKDTKELLKLVRSIGKPIIIIGEFIYNCCSRVTRQWIHDVLLENIEQLGFQLVTTTLHYPVLKKLHECEDFEVDTDTYYEYFYGC
jgi:hypothetical protein